MSDLIVDTKTYNLSTRSGSCILLNGDYKSNIQYDIPDMIHLDDTIEYIQYSIPYCIIPVSFYQINDTNNTLHLLCNGQDFTVTFENGNYNASYFMTQFKLLLGSNNGWNITFDTISSRFTITNTYYDFTLYGDSSIDYVMGFSNTISSSPVSYGTSTLTYQLNTIVMPRPCNFLSLPRICLRCPQLSNQGNMRGDVNTSDIVMTIPNNAKPNGQIVFNNIYSKTFLKADRIERLNVQFTDDDGNFINFNGISSFFIIQFDIYRKNPEKLPSFSHIQTLVNSATFENPHFLFKGK
jgi:hypothetical protein